MGAIGIVLKVISNLGQIETDFGDIKQAAADLFAGKLSAADTAKLLQDIVGLLSGGLISIPGVDTQLLISTINGGDQVVKDVIAAVSDIRSKGTSAIVPDLSKAVSDLTAAVSAGVVGLQNSTKEQVLEVLAEIAKGL